MAAPDRYTLTFADGEVREVTRRPIHMFRAEGIAGERGTMAFIYASLWAADTGGKGDIEAMELWLDTLDEWEPVKADEGDDAGPPARIGTESPT